MNHNEFNSFSPPSFLSFFEMNQFCYLRTRQDLILSNGISLEIPLRKANLLGGSPYSVVEMQVKDKVSNMIQYSPVTTAHIVLGVAFLPFQKYLVFKPILGHGFITSFFCLGSGFNVLKRLYGMAMYQAPTEELFSKASKYSFLQAQTVMASLIVTSQIIFTHYQPLLFPLLEHSNRWLWAFTSMDKSIQVYGYVSISPALFPFVLCFFESSFYECFVGLGTSLAAAWILNLKRQDGQPLLDYVHQTFDYYHNLFLNFIK